MIVTNDIGIMRPIRPGISLSFTPLWSRNITIFCPICILLKNSLMIRPSMANTGIMMSRALITLPTGSSWFLMPMAKG